MELEGMYNHKIKGQAKLIHERIKFHLIFMLEISVAEARWIMEWSRNLLHVGVGTGELRI